jgi:4-oxalocrotonate tautomerase
MDTFGYGPGSFSVAFEEVASDRWKEGVYLPNIQGRSGALYKKPGYQM